MSSFQITYDVIHEFADDNVKYLELRTTPREVTATGMTKETYVEAVLKAIEDCSKEHLDIVVKLLLAIDRRNSVAVGQKTVELADKYAKLSDGVVVGIDLSGDPQAGSHSNHLWGIDTHERFSHHYVKGDKFCRQEVPSLVF